MVQIKFSVLFLFVAATLAPVVARPVNNNPSVLYYGIIDDYSFKSYSNSIVLSPNLRLRMISKSYTSIWLMIVLSNRIEFRSLPSESKPWDAFNP